MSLAHPYGSSMSLEPNVQGDHMNKRSRPWAEHMDNSHDTPTNNKVIHAQSAWTTI